MKLSLRIHLMMIIMMMVMIRLSEALTELRCDQGCNCSIKNGREYRIICDKLADKDVYLSDSVFANPPKKVFRTYVRVADVKSLQIPQDFLQAWKSYSTCAMDLWRAGNVTFPAAVPMTDVMLSDHVFAGLGIVASVVPRIPPSFFSGKRSCSLRLQRTEVGVLPANLFSGVLELKYLKIIDSRIGLFQGPPSEEGSLLLKSWEKKAVELVDSSVGFLGPKALRFRASEVREVLLSNVSIGSVAVGAVELSGRAHLNISNSMLSDLQQGSLEIGETTLSLENSTVVAHPSALAAFTCHAFKNRILSNVVLVVSPPPPPTMSSLDAGDDNDTYFSTDITGRELVAWKLESVLHPTCVEYNLPLWARPEEGGTTLKLVRFQEDASPLLHLGLYAFVGVSVAALLIVVLLACLLVRARRRNPGLRDTVTVAMSDLRDPIYEDAPFVTVVSPPPPVPPPATLLREEDHPKGACGGGEKEFFKGIGGGEGGMETRPRGIENEYMFMKPS